MAAAKLSLQPHDKDLSVLIISNACIATADCHYVQRQRQTHSRYSPCKWMSTRNFDPHLLGKQEAGGSVKVTHDHQETTSPPAMLPNVLPGDYLVSLREGNSPLSHRCQPRRSLVLSLPRACRTDSASPVTSSYISTLQRSSTGTSLTAGPCRTAPAPRLAIAASGSSPHPVLRLVLLHLAHHYLFPPIHTLSTSPRNGGKK